MPTTTRRPLAFGLIGALLLFSVTLAAQPRRSAAGAARLVPYTVSLEEVTINAAGREGVASYQTFALRSDGARVVRLGRTREGGRTLVFPSGRRVAINDRSARKSTDYTASRGGPLQDPRANCARTNEVFAGMREIAGYRAAAVRVSSGDRSVEMFRAVDFSCAPLGDTMTFSTGERSVKRVTSFIPGEPAAELFEIGAHLIEGPPSMLEPIDRLGCDAGCQAQMKVILEMRDASYFRNQRPR